MDKIIIKAPQKQTRQFQELPCTIDAANILMVLFGLGLALSLHYQSHFLSSTNGVAWMNYFVNQDTPWLIFYLIITPLCFLCHPRIFDQRVFQKIQAQITVPRTITISTAITLLGTRYAYKEYELSMDEYLTIFQAAIFSGGKLMAEIPSPDRYLMPALQQIFMWLDFEHGYFAPNYKPINALLHLPLLTIGLENYTATILNAGSAYLTYLIARKLWPNVKEAHICAMLLLALSPQFIITGMSTYAMSAHLFFAQLWLLLILNKTPTSTLASLIVGFFATGLHQVHLFILFSAPFLFSFITNKRYLLASGHIIVYGLSIYFWQNWLELAYLSGLSDQSPAGLTSNFSSTETPNSLLESVLSLVDSRSLSDISSYTAHIIKSLVWMHPLMACLLLSSMIIYKDLNETSKCLLAALTLTLLAHLVLMPTQGHGWGYRYIHGLLGAIAIIAANTYTISMEKIEKKERLKDLLIVTSIISLVLIIPGRIWQVNQVIAPLKYSADYIKKSPSDIVLLESRSIWYGQDLIRNTPTLSNTPLVLHASRITPEIASQICKKGLRAAAIGISDLAKYNVKPALIEDSLNQTLKGEHFFDKLQPTLDCQVLNHEK